MPLVSIITPLHDKGAYVEETIRSLLSQTMEDWEMIVVENGSTDEGPGIVRSISDPRVRLVESRRLGPGAARNLGLSLASGDWILFLDADDLIGPDYLSRRLALREKFPLAEILTGRWTEFASPEEVKEGIRFPEGEGTSGRGLEDAAIAYAPWAVHAALVKRRRCLEHPWNEGLDAYPSEDTAFWFPVIRGAHVAYSTDASALYRIGTGNSRNRTSAALWLEAVKAVTGSNLDFLSRSGSEPTHGQALHLMKVYESCYRSALRQDDVATALRSLESASLWLKHCQPSTRGVILRKVLGIGLLNRMMRVCRHNP